MIRPAEKPPI